MPSLAEHGLCAATNVLNVGVGLAPRAMGHLPGSPLLLNFCIHTCLQLGAAVIPGSTAH